MAKKTVFAALILFVLSFILVGGNVASAAYPEKSVQLIVAYSAGGATDALARITAKYLEKELGKPFIVVNKAGSDGDIGFTSIAKAKPDGYTIGLINIPSIIVNPITRPKVVRYRVSDLMPIANVVTDPAILCVKADSPIKSIPELIAEAKKNPGKISCSREADYLGVLEFCKKSGIELNLVPFDGAAPAKAALLGGHIDMISAKVSEVAELVNAGQIRGLAVQDTRRSPELPNVPAFAELGYPTVIQGASRGFAVQKGVKPEVLNVLTQAMKKIVANPEYRDELKKLNMPIDYMDSEQFLKYIADQDKMWNDRWKADPWIKAN